MKVLFITFFVCAYNWAFAQQTANDSLVKIDTAKWNEYGMRMYDARLGRYFPPVINDSIAKANGFTRLQPLYEEKKKKSVKAK